MQKPRLVIALALVVIFGACREREQSLTAPSGSSKVSGSVLIGADGAGDAAGIEVRAVGTGLVTVTDSQGRFDLFGVASQDVDLSFHRPADGIDEFVTIADVSRPVVVTLEARSKPKRTRGARDFTKEVEGTVTAISEASITVLDARSAAEVTANITESTVIRHGNRALETTDIEIGDRVHVRLEPIAAEATTANAVEIKLQEGRGGNDGDDDDEGGVRITGRVVSVEGTDLLVGTDDGVITVKTDASTTIRSKGRELTLASIRTGDKVSVQGTRIDATTIHAKRITVEN